jgi:type IV pilus biogenesis protein PilP
MAAQASAALSAAVPQAAAGYTSQVPPPAVEGLDDNAPSTGSSELPSTANYQDELDELAALQRQLVILKAKSDIANTTLTIDQTIQSIKTATSAAAATSEQPSAAQASSGNSAPAVKQSASFVTMITGVPGSLKAFIDVSGTQMLVTEGTELPSGARVTSVSQSGVYTDGSNGTPLFIGMQALEGAGSGQGNQQPNGNMPYAPSNGFPQPLYAPPANRPAVFGGPMTSSQTAGVQLNH